MSEIPSGESRARRGVRYVSDALRNMGRNRIFAGASTVSDSSSSSLDSSFSNASSDTWSDSSSVNSSNATTASSSYATPPSSQSDNQASLGSSISNDSSSSSGANFDHQYLGADEGGMVNIPQMIHQPMGIETTYDQVLSDIVTDEGLINIYEPGIADIIGGYLGNSPHLFEDIMIERQRRQVNLNREMGRR